MRIPTDHSDVPLAIIGMACRLPGADNLEQYWRLIVEGRSSIAEAPADRFDRELYFDPVKGVRGKSYSKLAALLAHREFDAQRCPIDEGLRQSVDRTHLLMTGVAADALRHAGLDPFNLRSKNTAVFIGHGGSGARLRDSIYQSHLTETIRLLEQSDGFGELSPEVRSSVIRDCIARIQRPTLPSGVDNRLLYCNMIAGTISKAFGLTGGWLALNSACASSLQAILMGARALQQGRVEMAIVGGASDIHSHTLVLFSAAQALSSTGSRPFDNDADGLVMCEGFGALVLKTLERALADGDPIQAVVRGLGVATDGRGKSLWAPRKEGQIKAMQRAYRSGVELSQLQYIECHATATQLGDATELETLGEVLRPQLPPGKQIPVTSVKANIGHALEAAGIAGIIKTVLCIQQQTIPPAINIKQLNPKIDWKSAPYYVPTSPAAWDAPAAGQPRRAAVNAFGIGGLNMHVVLDEFTESAERRTAVKRTPSAQPQAAQPRSAQFQPAIGADDQSVAIIGMGCILPGGIGLTRFWETVQGGKDPKSAASDERWTPDSLAECSDMLAGMAGGFITDFTYDWRKHKVPPKQVAEADPLQFMLLEAAEQALNDAGYDRKPLDRERCGVVVGTEVGGEFSDQLEMGLRIPEMQQVLVELLRARGVPEAQVQTIKAGFSTTILRKWPSLIDETGSFTSSTLASRVTKTLDLAGGAVAVDSGSISALSGLAICFDMLLSGDNDLMICAAGQRRMGANAFESLQRAGLLAGPVTHNVLDAGYDGVVPAEGVGVVVLKRLADARRDGDRIHAIIRGLGMAHHASQPEALRLAAERACAQAAIDPAEIQLVELDTDERLTADGEELQALAAAHGGATRTAPLAFGSSTAQFGHLGGGGGITALIKASLEVENAQIAPNVALGHPAQALHNSAQAVLPVEHAAPLPGRRLGAVASWSKGLASYIILEQGAAVPASETVKRPDAAHQNNGNGAQSRAAVQPSAAAQPRAAAPSPRVPSPVPVVVAETAVQWQICRLAGATLNELVARIELVQRDAAQAWPASAGSSFGPADRFRLAVVADSPQTLLRKLQLARAQLNNSGARLVLEQQGVFYHEQAAAAPRVVFVFPGQGSQYDGMLHELVRDEPAARQALGEVNAALNRLGYPTFEQLAWPAAPGRPTELGSDIWTTQVSMLAADAIVLATLSQRGIVPDLVLGHSYGEFAALYAAGAWDLETTIRLTRARCEGVAAAVHDTGLLATDAAPQLIETLAAAISSELQIANFNAPDQSVVGGRRPHLEALARSLQAHSHQARILSVPAAFHTPLMHGASGLLEQALAGATIRPLRIPLVSTVTNAAVRDTADIRRNLAAQLTTPVRYESLIRQLAGERPTVFVEVGPQQTLTRLNRRILGNGAWLVASDNAKRPGSEPVLCVQALLECLGAFTPAAQRPPQTLAQPSLSPQPVSRTKPMPDTPIPANIPHFDATERRRAKMRGTPADSPAPKQNGHALPAPANGNGNTNGNGNGNGNGHRTVERAAPSPVPARSLAPAAPTKSHAAPSPAAPSHAVKSPVAPAPAPSAVKPQQVLPKPPVAVPAPVAVASSAPVKAAAPAPTTAAPAPEQLESFLVNFVVEQTGYPPEVVDLDADLEADLGIDSIKKAQLFGELDELVGIGATVGTGAGNLSLDDFPTLRHVLNFLRSNQPAAPQAAVATQPAPAAQRAPAQAAPAALAPVATPNGKAPANGSPNATELEPFLVNFVVEQTGYPPEVVDLDADLEADLGIDSIKKAQLFGELDEHVGLGAVVGTGAGNLSLDDFPTLRHVLNFLKANQQTAAAPQPVAAPAVIPVAVTPAAAASAAPAMAATTAAANHTAQPTAARDTAELESFLVNFVVEQTGYPPEVVDLDADLEADLGIDSIKKAQLFGELDEHIGLGASIGTGAGNLSLDDFPTLRHVLNFLSQAGSSPPTVPLAPTSESRRFATADPAPVVATAHDNPAPVTAAAAPAGDTAQLESFLINFVVEQTGYPPEVVDLDADLEADLGIDSIKKAQLFGELDEHVGLGASIGTGAGNLSLDDFPTLRHVLNFLSGTQAGAAPAAETNGHAAAPAIFPRVVGNDTAANGTEIPALDEPSSGPLQLAGTPYDIGWQHGQAFKTEILRILQHYAEAADGELDELPGAAGRACPQQTLSADELDELQGLADAVEVPLGNILAHHFAILSEWGAGAGQCAVTSASAARGQMVQALRQPLPLLNVLAEATQPTLLVRVPASGLAHAAIAPIGTVGLWGGINSAGIAVTAHPLVGGNSAATGRGRTCSSAIRQILESASDLESAIQLAGSAGSTEPWCAFVSHVHSNRIVWLEFNGSNLTVRPVEGTTCEGPDELGLEADLSSGALTANSGEGETTAATAITLAIEPAAGEIRLGGRTSPQRWTVTDLLPAGRPTTDKAASPARSVGQALPPISADSVCQRFSLEMRAAPLAPGAATEPVWSGAAIVLGANPTADALIARLQGAGVTVYALSPDAELDVVLSQVEQICAAGPAPHLFITTARDGAPIDFDHDELWSRERYRSMALPFFVSQKWLQAALAAKYLDRCTLVATTAEDGDFGFARGAEAAQGGALAGLLKGIFVEFVIMQNEHGLRVKVIDAPAAVPAGELAADVFSELASGWLDYEVAFVGGRRFVPTAVEREPAATGDAAIQPGSTWIVTGGARGITAACALELGRRYGLRLHLIGSTPLEPIDPAMHDLDEEGLKQLKVSVMIAARKAGRNAAQAWERTKKDIEIDRSLRAFAAAGVSATYHPCDVSDRVELARTLDAVRAADGPIAGILHGAGLERSCRFDKKQREIVLQTIDIKVGGAANLMALTRRDPIRHFVGFGSISGRLGGFGQTDYSLANEMLAKLLGAYRRRRPWIKAVTFHWHAWGEIGMAARPELKGILEGDGNLSFLPPHEGIAHLVRELAAGAPEPEVMITERRHWAKFTAGLAELNSAEANGAEPNAAAPSGAQTNGAPTAAPSAAGPATDARRPLLTNIRPEGQTWLADLPLDPLGDPFLVQHRLRGRPLLPVVVGLEALAEIAMAASGQRVAGFRDVDMIDGLLFHTDRPTTARVRATPRADGGFDCELTCDFRNRAGGLIKQDRPYLRATVVLSANPPALVGQLPAMPDLSRWLDIVYPDHAPVYHGPPFRGATSGYCYDDADGWAHIAAHPLQDLTGAGRADGWTVPSVVLDSAMYACGLHLWARGGNIIALPRGIAELDLGRAPRDGEQCLLYLVCRSLAMERPCYDFELIGDDGALLLCARGYYKVSFGRGDAL